ncbi:MAG TPA: hypothetical protein PLB55_02760 [Prosthecobacter sp.]|nr:hypothetical protein [Prosthecobacter sp.]
MKTILLSLGLVFAGLPFLKADDPKAGYHGMAGPSGGRLLVEMEPHVEFFVNDARKVEIRFVGLANIVIAPGEQEVSVVIGEGAKAATLTFTKAGDKLVSDQPVPAGNDLPVVVQIYAKAGAKPVTESFKLNLTPCPAGKHPQYACICEAAKHKKPEQK